MSNPRAQFTTSLQLIAQNAEDSYELLTKMNLTAEKREKLKNGLQSLINNANEMAKTFAQESSAPRLK